MFVPGKARPVKDQATRGKAREEGVAFQMRPLFISATGFWI
ncbi:hypothetical protein ANRL4_02648 [Anaerolineae bacterium]|nr:hypothetical protein ANRL4_02648 [Anaerolineae bacterium]